MLNRGKEGKAGKSEVLGERKEAEAKKRTRPDMAPLLHMEKGQSLNHTCRRKRGTSRLGCDPSNPWATWPQQHAGKGNNRDRHGIPGNPRRQWRRMAERDWLAGVLVADARQIHARCQIWDWVGRIEPGLASWTWLFFWE